MSNEGKKRNNTRQNFLLDYFFKGRREFYEVLEVSTVNGDYVLVKQIHGETGNPIVAIYPKENWARTKEFNF